MSDSESTHSHRDLGVHADEQFDEVLDDHRHQPSSLPPPSSNFQQPPISILENNPYGGESLTIPQRSGRTDTSKRYARRSSRSHSFGDGDLDPKDQRHLNQNISFKKSPSVKKKRKNTRSGSSNLEADLASPMMRMKTNDTVHSDEKERARRPSESSIDSDVVSHGSRSSQETEEDVCFPMLREHVREANGINLAVLDEFINEERSYTAASKLQQESIQQNATTSSRARHHSTASLKYTPKNILRKTLTNFKLPTDNTIQEDKRESSSYDDEKGSPLSDDFVTFTNNRSDSDSNNELPERFTFFNSNMDETVRGADLPGLTHPGQSIDELFNYGDDGIWWLDCTCPTDAEMKVISKAFGLHPLTSEDIRVQESREKVELFRNYYFVCFHTFEPDKESEDYLEPINVYIVVFRTGILTFHFSPVDHGANVRRRLRQLSDYVDATADWICYAIIDDITDAFIPVITGIEYEADAIEDSVFVARETDFGLMLQRIGESRRKVMTLMRLLSGKADVIKMFAKRCQDEAFKLQPQPIPSSTNLSGMDQEQHPPQQSQSQFGFGHDGSGGISFGPQPGAPPNMMASNQYQFHSSGNYTQPRADIALYLGDIQDHVVTMFQNLLAYEKIFSRSHTNYLAQLQVESVNSNNKVTAMLSQVTVIGTILLPLNVITGLFGMNVTVPGQDGGTLQWFFGILGFMAFVVLMFFLFARFWLKNLLNPEPERGAGSSRRSLRSFGIKKMGPAKSIVSFPGYD